MKFKTGRTLLKHINKQPLPELELEDVSMAIQACEVRRNVEVFNMNIGKSGHLPNCFSTPVIFKQPVSYDSPHSFRTPVSGRQRLINLSFSQPSTPNFTKSPTSIRTSCRQNHPTPSLSLNTSSRTPTENLILSTPMIINILSDVQAEAFNPESLGLYPDILQIIDDDNGATLDTLERQLKLYSSVELNDENVIEYLLDLSQETRSKTHIDREPRVEIHHPLRKCRHAKPMSKEERQSLQKLQKEKQKLRRKDRLKKPASCGTRRSKRIRKPVKYS